MDNDFRDRFRRPAAGSPPPHRPAAPRPISRPQPSVPAPAPARAPIRTQTLAPPSNKPPLKQALQVEETIIPRNFKEPKSEPKKGKRKILIIAPLVLILTAASAGGFWWYTGRGKSAQIANEARQTLGIESTKLKPTGKIRLIATGDNFTFDSVNNAAKKPDGSYDYLPLFAGVKPFFDKSDVKLCNESVPTGGTLSGISGFPDFNAPPAFAKGLGDLGCNVINMATYHMNDKGQAAIDATVGYWDNQPEMLAVAGANRSADEQAKIRYFTSKSIKFAFLAYTTSTNNAQLTPHGVNIYTDALAQQQVTEARKNADFVIVSMNWGAENSPDIDSNQEHIAQVLADLNADVVIGVGPHILQPVKVLASQDQQHQTLVWFSLGNFLNSQVPVENLIGGMAVMDIDIETQNIVNPSFLPFYMHYEWTAEQKKRQSQPDLLARSNLQLVPLDQAGDLLAKSQNNTTVQAQTDRVKAIMTKFVPLTVITSAEF